MLLMLEDQSDILRWLRFMIDIQETIDNNMKWVKVNFTL